MEVISSENCKICQNDLGTNGGSAFNRNECKMCLTQVKASKTSISNECDLCMSDIIQNGEFGAGSNNCNTCADQWKNIKLK